MLHNAIFGLPKNLLKLLSTTQSANGVTAQVEANGLVTLNGTATADTTFTLPANAVTLGTGVYTASLTAKNGYTTGAVTAAFQQAAQAAQVITNGNFENGITGWETVSANATTSNETITLTAVGTDSGEHMLQQWPFAYVAGHKYCCFAYASVMTAIVKLKVYYNQPGIGYVENDSNNINAGQSGRLSVIVQLPSNVSDALFRVALQNSADQGAYIANGENAIISSCMVVDMGADASNPLYNLTVDQMSTLFPSYFSGTQTITMPTPLASISAGSPSTFTTQAGQTIPSVQIAIPSGTSCQQYQIGLQVESGSTATGWVSPGAQGIVFYPAVGETGAITNTGNVDAYPVITVTGTCANPTVTNDTTGETVAVNIALGTADTLVIDCRPATRGCYLNGSLAFGIKQGLGWIHCPPGENILTFSRDGYDTKRHCAISLQGRYL